MLVGFHVEGWDHLLYKALLANLLDIPEEEIFPDCIGIEKGTSGRGWGFIFNLLPKALHRFYHKCASLVIVGVDNDGNVDIQAEGEILEDPDNPRHWNHEVDYSENCRWCKINKIISNIRPKLNYIQNKPGNRWPIIIAVPVEQVESWLLVIKSILDPGEGRMFAENEARRKQKMQFWSKPAPNKEDVEKIALPLIRLLNVDNIETLKQHSKSFANFSDQVAALRDDILNQPACWKN